MIFVAMFMVCSCRVISNDPAIKDNEHCRGYQKKKRVIA
jgi:hypothetical protein